MNVATYVYFWRVCVGGGAWVSACMRPTAELAIVCCFLKSSKVTKQLQIFIFLVALTADHCYANHVWVGPQSVDTMVLEQYCTVLPYHNRGYA